MLTKLVKGKTVVMSAEEESAMRAEWAANDAKPPEPPKETIEEKLDKLLTEFITLKKDVEDLKNK